MDELIESLKIDVSELRFENQKLDSYTSLPVKNSLETPLYVHLDNGTDIGVVLIGVAGIITSAIVGYFSYRSQKNQIRANACNLRHHWINELRGIASEFLQLNSTITHRSLTDQDYDDSDEYYADYRRSLELHVKINLMVSSASVLGKRITTDAESLVELVKMVRFGLDDAANVAFNSLATLEKSVKQQLDEAWDDIKGDLGISRRGE